MYGALRALFLNTNYHELSMNYFMNFFVNAYSFRQFQIAVYRLSVFLLQSIAKIDRLLPKNEMHFIFHIKVAYICNVFHFLRGNCYDRTY